jgi:uncharacterized protein with PIN domain
MPTARFRFHGNLNFFLPRRLKNKEIVQEFDWKASIKDMVESIAPPHPEIELILVNGKSVGWDYIVQADDTVDAYPDYTNDAIAEKVRLIPPYPHKPRFVLDTHLGKLANYLRMMGFDTLYRNDYDDDELAETSHHEERIVLTRDLGVLKRGLVIYGYFVRNTDPNKQLVEISERYGLKEHLQPFARCMACNGELLSVEKESILHLLAADTAAHFNKFQQCQACAKVYWRGGHHERMEKMIEAVMGNTS